MHVFTTLKPAKRLLVLAILIIAAVVIVPAMANFQSVNAIVNTRYVAIKSPISSR